MQLLKLDKKYLEEKGGLYTAEEINSQPELWQQTTEKFYGVNRDIKSFLQTAYSEVDNIILTGAGTSSFVGLSLFAAFAKQTQINTRAIATTDIVSHPQDYFNDYTSSLIISFARSGNSPESCAALELADKFSKKCFHLIITCNKNGSLASYHSESPSYVFILPDAANDKGLAMTGSYTAMLLTGLMIAYMNQPQIIQQQLPLISKAASNILQQADIIKNIADKDFKRAVFLGSGILFGTAQEAALKLQELTDGRIICKTDTYLGLRHGPKAVVDNTTLVVYFLNNNNHVKRYEHDLVNAMNNGTNAMHKLSVGETAETLNDVEDQLIFGIKEEEIAEDFLPVCAVVAGQLLGFYKSMQLGLEPDQPSVSGSITRVVEGVTIYPVESKTAAMSFSEK